MALPAGAQVNIDGAVTRLKRGVARVLVYAGLSDALILWGGIFLVNDAIICLLPGIATATYGTGAAGLAGTFLIAQIRGRQAAHAANAQRLFWCFGTLVAALFLWQMLGIPVPLRNLTLAQANAGVLFQLTFIMLGLILLGIWTGRFVLGLGLGLLLAVLADYLAAPGSFIGSAMLLTGLALLAAGLWMRQAARRIGAGAG